MTGHSLGGYLAQIVAAELYAMGVQSQVQQVSYFNGMGLFPFSSAATSLWALKENVVNALLYYAGNDQLELHQISGDLVSELGTHFGVTQTYEPTQEAIDNHAGQLYHEWNWHWWELGIGTIIRENVEGVIFGAHNAIAYVWYTHETDSFFYHLIQGVRDRR